MESVMVLQGPGYEFTKLYQDRGKIPIHRKHYIWLRWGIHNHECTATLSSSQHTWIQAQIMQRNEF